MRRGELIDAFQIPARYLKLIDVGDNENKKGLHLVTEPLHFVYNVETAVHNEGVHPSCFGTEPSNTIAALLRGAEFELK